MTDNVVPLRFNVQQVGKHVKASKKRFTWDISLNGRQHSVVLDFSFISGKVKVTVDRKILLENQLPANTSFQYPFTLDGNALNVIQQGDNFELRINNKVFSHLYNQMKTNKQFKKYEDEVRDFRVQQNQFQAKKITLNIGGVGGGMKKKPKNQSANEGLTWNAFGQDQMSGFPSYFQGQSVSTSNTSNKSSKVEQKTQNKVQNLLDQNSNFQNSQKKQQTPQNILQFQSQIQNQPVYNTSKPSQKDQFSTMQMLFTTMKVDPTKQYQSKQPVVVTNQEVDFFSSPNQQINLTPSKPQPQNQSIDFFSQIQNSSVNNNSSANKNTANNMGMFATTSNLNGNSEFGLNQGITFNTSSGIGIKNENSMQNLNLNMNMNFGALNNNFTLQTQQPKSGQYNTMQNLFATGNTTTMSQGYNLPTNQAPLVSSNVNQSQTNITGTNLNMQHFATTQQLPTQNFSTGFNIQPPQAFGTQNYNNLQGSNINFNLQQQNTVKSNISLSNPTQPTTPVQPVQSSVDSININDFHSMQQLFKTNSFNMQPTLGQTQTQQVSSGVDIGFSQQFGTGNINQSASTQVLNQSINAGSNGNGISLNMGTSNANTGSTVQSPNTMFMNTYSGSSNPNTGFGGFDMGFGSGQQFNTLAGSNVNSGMMKKPTPLTGNVNQSTSNSGNDLI